MRDKKLLKLRLLLTLKSIEVHKKYIESTKRVGPFIFFLLTITFLELVSRKIMIGTISPSIINILIFTLPFALLGTILTKLLPNKANKVILFILTFILCI